MAVSTKSKLVVEHNGLTVQFDNNGHVYRVFDKEKKLKHKPISVTTLIHKYQKPFDLEGMSLKCAQKEGVTQDEIKQRWAKINRTACGYGTKMHRVAEKIFNGEEIDFSSFSPEEVAVHGQISKVVSMMRNRPYVYESEKIVFDPGINVAGTIDLVGRNQDTGDYLLVDWKTNKRIKTMNEYGEKMLAPLSEVDDCEFNVYGLQLSLYERILKKGGYVDPDAEFRKFICHFHPIDGVHWYEIKATEFSDRLDRLVGDWMAKKEAIAKANEDIPNF